MRSISHWLGRPEYGDHHALFTLQTISIDFSAFLEPLQHSVAMCISNLIWTLTVLCIWVACLPEAWHTGL